MKAEFIELIDRHYEALGYDDRSKFVRAAIKEKLELMHIDVPDDLAMAPSRIGKGGPQNKTYPPQPRRNFPVLSEKSSSKQISEAQRIAAARAAKVHPKKPSST